MSERRFPETEPEESITQRWTNILKNYLEEAGYRNPARPRVLNAGCGEFGEVGALVKYFGKDSEIIGVDRDAEQVRLAEDRVKKYPNVSVLQPQKITDLAKIYHEGYYENYFDAVITRQPHVTDCSNNWGGNYRAIGGFLKHRGYLLATFRQEKEMRIARRMIDGSWLLKKSPARNRFAISIPERDAVPECATATDVYVLVAMRYVDTLSSLQASFLPQTS